ncbi:MAG: phenylalanine--tRNA ligase subunit beta [Candidatus Gracilibacteria bacterium]
MKLALSTITDYTEPPFSPTAAEAKDLLNQMGAEVESVTKTRDGDTVFDLEITPNRPDLLGVVGVVRELMAATRTDIRATRKHVDKVEAEVPHKDVQNNLSNPTDCPTYQGRRISGVKVGPSPEWLVTFLEKHGIKSINNIVDISNYVMIETGHPIHIYDAEKVEGGIVSLRNAGENEAFTGIGGTQMDLKNGHMVIVDGSDNILALAGVLGGQSSQVTDSTTDIIIESAYFSPQKVRKASKANKISTEASFRFERGADPKIPTYALDRATALIQENAEGTVTEELSYGQEQQHTQKRIRVTYTKIDKYLGVKVDKDFSIKALQSLGFEIVQSDEEGIEVLVPSWRSHDVKRDVCLIEEIGKVYGNDNIPSVMPKSTLTLSRRPLAQQIRETVDDFFLRTGFNEVINYGFCSPKDFEDMGIESPSKLREFVAINVPLSGNFSVMRTSLIPGLVRNHEFNANRGQKNIKVYEVGRTFHKAEGHPQEIRRIGGLMSGKMAQDTWKRKETTADFYDLKSIIYGLLKELGIDEQQLEVSPANSEFVEAGGGAKILIDGVSIGFFGYLKTPKKSKKKTEDILVFELDIDSLEKHCTQKESTVEQPSRFPSIIRDVTFDCPQNFLSQSIADTVNNKGHELVKKVELVDTYVAKGSEGQISLSFRIEFNSAERALTNEEVSAIMDKIIADITSSQQISLRG